MANYNYAQYIEEAINSVISQSYQDWELIIVDDGSRDNSVEIIKSYCEKDSRIKLFTHDNGVNRGLKESILLGLEHASGEWIAFLESDDIFEPDNLAKKVEIIEDAKMHRGNDVKLIFNKVKFLTEEKRKQQNTYQNIQAKLSKMGFPRNMFYDFAVDNMILTFSCVIVEANVLKQANFNTPCDASLDKWLWIHLAYKNDFYYIDQELTRWRLHSSSYIKKAFNPIFMPTQIQAYVDVYNNEGKSLRLLLFIVISYIKLFFVRGFKFIF